MKKAFLPREAVKVWLEAEVARLNSILKKQGLSKAKRYDICGTFFFSFSVFLDQGEFSLGGNQYRIDLRASENPRSRRGYDLHDFSEAVVERIVDEEDLSAIRAAGFTPAPISNGELGVSKLWGLRLEFESGRFTTFTILLDLARPDDILLKELRSDLRKLGDQTDAPVSISRILFAAPGKGQRKIGRKNQFEAGLTGEGVLRLFRDEAKKG
jgi:hypothetical protein